MTNEREELERRDEYCDTGENVSASQEAESLREERARLENALRRAQADLVNYRNRMETEKSNLLKYGNQRLLVRLLPILDELEMAVEQSPDGAASDSWLEGFRLINRKLQALLELEGVERVEALGKPFDPAEHEAVHEQQSADIADGHVLMVYRDGYKISDRVLRPAQVVVAVNDGPAPDDTDADPVSDN